MTGGRRPGGTAADPVVRHVDTPHGPALLTVHPVAEARGVLLLGHGAGGGFGAPDLRTATTAALAAGLHDHLRHGTPSHWEPAEGTR